MKEYIKPEIEYVQLITEDVTVDLGSGNNPFGPPAASTALN